MPNTNRQTGTIPRIFPQVYRAAWGADFSFTEGEELSQLDSAALRYVFVHAYYEGRIVLADIVGRGICIPSGHIEAGETPIDAALRETFEETGALVSSDRCKLIGYQRFERRRGQSAEQPRIGAVFVAEVSRFVPIPGGSESRGRSMLPIQQISEHYFMWDELMAAIFDFADRERARLLGN